LQPNASKAQDVRNTNTDHAGPEADISPAPNNNENPDASEDDASHVINNSEEEGDSDEDSENSEAEYDDEPYGSGPVADRDQSGALTTNLSAEDELAMDMAQADADDAHDAYYDEHPEVIYEEMGLASDSDDSEDEAERKRSRRADLENELENFDYDSGY
jgi:hypothetical protein